MRASLLICTVNIVIGNGCGQHVLTAGRSYRLSHLQADLRLLPGQIRAYFKEADKVTIKR